VEVLERHKVQVRAVWQQLQQRYSAEVVRRIHVYGELCGEMTAMLSIFLIRVLAFW
jgi:hypothetical protein